MTTMILVSKKKSYYSYSRLYCKTYLFGPIADNSTGLIKKVQVDYHTNTNIKAPKREVRYIAEPRALKDYNDDA